DDLRARVTEFFASAGKPSKGGD
ncbi:MAG: hypothetical protein RL309_479, partial [Verrucomicrobiota bacterium]